ncbi:MAG: hypothetical protein AAF908_02405 [Pseudomonadota bacterium]
MSALRFAVITTTIHVPHVMELHARLRSDADIIVAGDRKSPHAEIRAIAERHPNFIYLDVEAQEAMGTKCSEVIGWNSIQRRNLALLQAISRGADVIVTVDDDNLPMGPDYIDRLEALFSAPFHGLSGETRPGWFNACSLFDADLYHRGYPLDKRDGAEELVLSPVWDAEIGVAAGLWLGDPDIDATTRLVNGPIYRSLSDVAAAGVVALPETWTVFNSQNTAYRRELAPLMMVAPGLGRYDDIWGAYIAKRILRESPWSVHFGPPVVWQQRNEQNVLVNLEKEIMGMRETPRFIQDLEAFALKGSTPFEQFRNLTADIGKLDYMPRQAVETWAAFCEDVDRILSA